MSEARVTQRIEALASEINRLDAEKRRLRAEWEASDDPSGLVARLEKIDATADQLKIQRDSVMAVRE